MFHSDRIPGFRSDGARRKFEAAYDRALERLWPVPVDVEDLPVGAGTLRVYRAGGRGPDPYVLLTGAGGNALSWYHHVGALAAHRPVVVVDPLGEPGRSATTAPVADPDPATCWLEELLTAVGAERAHLVGMSLGGWLALQHEVRRPGRVAAVTLLDPAGFARLGLRFYRWVVLGGMAGVLLPAGLRRGAARRLHNPTIAEEELMRLGRAGVGLRRPATVLPVLTDAELRAVGVPVQVLLGERSAAHDARAVADRLAGVVPRWRVEVVPGAGHALPLDDVDLVLDRVLAFPPGAEGERPDRGQVSARG